MLRKIKTTGEAGGSAGQQPTGAAIMGFFFRSRPQSSFEQERFANLLEKIQFNKFKFLVDMPSDSRQLKEGILAELDTRFHEHDRALVKRAFAYVDYFYEGVKRKDQITEASAHVYQVAYGTLLVGCDFEAFIASLFHDLKEDTKKGWSKKTADEVNADLLGIAGPRIVAKSDKLTHDKKEQSYHDYLEEIYQSGDLQLMVVKAIDMIRNLSTLYYENSAEKTRNSVVSKALEHVEIWKKLNRNVFELMFMLITDNAPAMAKTEIENGILSNIEQLKGKSLRQKNREIEKLVVINWRGDVNLSLLSDLPDSGSPVITVYFPRHLQPENELEIEFPAGAGGAEYIRAKLRAKLPWMAFEQVQSKLPPELVCTTIFKTKIPEDERHDEFLAKLHQLAEHEKEMHGRTLEFFSKKEN